VTIATTAISQLESEYKTCLANYCTHIFNYDIGITTAHAVSAMSVYVLNGSVLN